MADPKHSQQLGFWLLLGVTSTVFAEVLFPTTAFDLATMALFAVPIYLLHSVVLAGVVYRADRVSYETMYLAGVLLGLYEAYVTKVVWAPLGDRPVFEAGGVYLFETVGLVLFWHPVVAFLLPVTVVETVATASNRSLGPPLADHRFARPLVGTVTVYLLLFQGSLGGPVRALLANVVALSVLLVGVFVWRRTDGHTHDMETLLPDDRSLGVLAVCLVGVVISLGTVIRPEKLPRRPLPHLLVILMYLVAGGLLTLLLRGDHPTSAWVSVEVTWRQILSGSAAIALGSPVLGLVGGSLALLVFLSYYAVAIGVAVASFVAVGLVLRS